MFSVVFSSQNIDCAEDEIQSWPGIVGGSNQRCAMYCTDLYRIVLYTFALWQYTALYNTAMDCTLFQYNALQNTALYSIALKFTQY